MFDKIFKRKNKLYCPYCKNELEEIKCSIDTEFLQCKNCLFLGVNYFGYKNFEDIISYKKREHIIDRIKKEIRTNRIKTYKRLKIKN